MSKARKITEELDVPLTEAELRAKGDELAAKENERSQLEEEKKDAARAFRVSLNELKESIDTLAKDIGRKATKRPIACEVEIDIGRAAKVVRRIDTREVVREEALDAQALEEARQADLFPGPDDEPPVENKKPDDDAGGKPSKKKKAKRVGPAA